MLTSVINSITDYVSSQTLIFCTVMFLLMYIAWLSTGIEPLNYRLWMVQLFSCHSHQVLRVHDVQHDRRDHNYLSLPPTVSPDVNPRISTVVFVHRPTEIHGPAAPRTQYRFFGDLAVDEAHQRALADFIYAQTEVNACPQGPQEFRIPQRRRFERFPNSRQTMLREVIQQLHIFGRGEELNTTNASSASQSSASSLPTARSSTVPPQQAETAVIASHRFSRQNTEVVSGPPPPVFSDDNITVILRDCAIRNAADDCHIQISITATVLEFKTQCFPNRDFSNERLIHQGILLENDALSIGRYGLRDQSIVLHIASQAGVSDFEMFKLRLKYLDDRIVETHIPLHTTVGELKRQTFPDELAQGRVIRLIFQGSLLRNDSKTLTSYGLVDDSVLHVHIGQAPYRREGDSVNQDESQNAPQNNANQPLGFAPVIVTGYAPLDALFLFLLSTILWIVRWSETEDVDEGDSYSARMSRAIRSIIRYCATIVATIVTQPNPQNEQESQYQLGELFYFVIFLKLSLLFLISAYFPQFVDLKSIFLLSVISCMALLFLWCNRQRASQQTHQ